LRLADSVADHRVCRVARELFYFALSFQSVAFPFVAALPFQACDVAGTRLRATELVPAHADGFCSASLPVR